jgi:hypothetical protein
METSGYGSFAGFDDPSGLAPRVYGWGFTLEAFWVSQILVV